MRLVSLLVLVSALLFGQLTRGTLSGTIEDPSGAVIPDAIVKITNNATNISSETRSNQEGIYRFVAVEPGVYSVVFSKAGFDNSRIENVQVSTYQDVTLNQALVISTAVTTIDVTGTAVGVELAKGSPTIERTLSREFIENAALTGSNRDITRLALLAPTVSRGPGLTDITANGNRARNNNYTLDGVDNNDIAATVISNRAISEGVAEFQVQTAAYSAEYGRNSGAQINIITKAGTNAFHGEAFDYYRGNWMEPVSLLNKRAGLTSTPRFVHNQAGGAFQGPIIRDRTFFFGLVETNRRREAPDARRATAMSIPTPTGYAALRTVPLREGQPAQSREAVLNAISFLPDVHQQIGGAYQNVRTVAVNGVPIEVGTATIPLANPYDYWYYQARLDHKLTENQNLTYRLQIDKRNEANNASNLQFGDRFSAAQVTLGQNHMATHKMVLSPTLINEGRFSYVRRNLNFPENDPVSPTANIIGMFFIGGLSNYPQARVQDTFQMQDTLTKMFGRHSLRFGADIRYLKYFNRSGFHSKGTFTFNSLQDYMNNSLFQFEQAVNEASFDTSQWQSFFYFQDDFKLTRDLTLNLGLRYEYGTVPADGWFGATTPEIAATLVPLPARPDKNNWGPRFGFSYSPSQGGWLLGDGLTVFRGGYGVGYDILFFNIATSNANNYPRVVTFSRNGVLDQYPTLIPKEAVTPAFNPLLMFGNTPEDIQNPTSHFYSFSIQRQFAKVYIAEIGYSGNRNYHQIRQGQFNPGILTEQQAADARAGRPIPTVQQRRLYPQFGPRVSIESTANSNYNALYFRFDRRYANGLLVGANYTWSKTMSDADEPYNIAEIVPSSPQVPQDYFNYRNEWSLSIFDRTHRLAIHYNYDIPGAKTFRNPVLRHALGGWIFNGFHEWQSGQPFTVRTGVDTGGTGTAAPHRPDYNPAGILNKDPVTGDFRTFSTPLNGTGIFVTALGTNGFPLQNSKAGGGNLGRNTFRGPGFVSTNFSLGKNFSLTERWKLRVRADFINAFNQRNFGNPVAVMNSPTFGQNTSDPGGRTMLFLAKIIF